MIAIDLEGKTDNVSWLPPEGMTYAKWEEEGRKLQSIDAALNWWLGDWLVAGEKRYGETYAQAIEVTGHKLEQLTVCKYVAGRVKRLTRIKDLSWTHHRYVASVESDEEQANLLRAAVEFKLSSKHFLLLVGLDKFVRDALIGQARALGLSGDDLVGAIEDYKSNLTEQVLPDDVPFDDAPSNPLYSDPGPTWVDHLLDDAADAVAGEAAAYDWSNAQTSDDGQRRILRCVGLWEYDHTDEDGCEHYRLTGVTPSPGVAQMWLVYANGSPIIKVKQANPLDEYAAELEAAGVA